MKKLTSILFSVLLSCPLFAQEISSLNVEYKESQMQQKYQTSEYKGAIERGLNYWNECVPVKFSLVEEDKVVGLNNNGLINKTELLTDGSPVVINESSELKKNKFKIVWDETIPGNQWGEANYLKKRETDEVVGFLIKINANKDLSLKDLELILAHEIGHVIGVEHNMESDSVMHYNGTKLESKKNKEKDISECRRSDLNKIKV